MIDWAQAAPGLFLFCAVLAFSRWRFVAFATDQRASTTLALIAEAFGRDRWCPGAGAGRSDGLPEGRRGRQRGDPHRRTTSGWPAITGSPRTSATPPIPQSKGIVENLCGYAQRDLAVPLLTDAAITGTPGFVRSVARTIASLRTAHPRMVCEGVGVSLPGRVDETGRLVFAPNLGWRDVDLRRMLESATGLPVNVENAANACALGELWFGRHDEHLRHLVAVTVSEGIGVGVLLNGQLVRGANAMAGEFGHMTFDETGPPCCCGKRGCWERYASNSAAVDYYTSEGAAKRGAQQPGLRFEDLIQRLAADGDRARHRDTRADGADSSAQGWPPSSPASPRRSSSSSAKSRARGTAWAPSSRTCSSAGRRARRDPRHPDRPRDAAAPARRGDARHPAALRRAQRGVVNRAPRGSAKPRSRS